MKYMENGGRMKYAIIGDSCSDLGEKERKEGNIQLVPLMLEIGDYHILDDENFNQLDFLKRVKESPVGPKTACPTPLAFKDAIEATDAEAVFIVTLSEHLSGTYQSAVLGKQMYEEEQENPKKVFVLSSHSASAGQYRIITELQQLMKEGLGFEEIVEKITALRDKMKTYFVLETLETLRKNGRISGLSAFFATALNIKPVMGAVEGTIVKLDQVRGINKALKRMVALAVEEVKDALSDVTVCITHVNNPERAKYVENLFREAGTFKDILLSDAAGVATVYACDGGVVIGIA